MNTRDCILIAGGTGLIGRRLVQAFKESGHEVRVLTRRPSAGHEYFWNPNQNQMDSAALSGVTVLINLSGEGIADKRWTSSRKRLLESSRIGTNQFLYSRIEHMPELRQFVCASGINAYPSGTDKIFVESNEFGKDFLSVLVEKWEKSADLFSSNVPVATIRTAVVLAAEGGAFQKLSRICGIGAGSPLGSGKQPVPWIHIDDLVNIYVHAVEHRLSGAYNAITGCTSNGEFMEKLSKKMNKPYFLPKVPSLLMKILLGEMSVVLLSGLCASNQKIRETGFTFTFDQLDKAFENLLLKLSQ